MIDQGSEEQKLRDEFYSVLRDIDGKGRLERDDWDKLTDSLYRYIHCPSNIPDGTKDLFKEFERIMRKFGCVK